jgi:hypothetical protein
VKRTTLTIVMLISTAANVANAMPVAEMKKRAAIDQAMVDAAADIKDCGKKFTLAFDWKAYDAIDWKAAGQDKQDWYAFEQATIAKLGAGLNAVCADKDYKAALGKIGKITYKATNDTKIKVKVVISGSSMTIENYSFGSTRDAEDYESAAKAAL